MNDKFSEVIKKLVKADDAYYNSGHSIMSDQEYDSLREYARSKEPEHPYFEKIGEKPSSLWGKAVHKIPMGSLDKVHTEKDFVKWAEKFPGETFIIQPKIDGFSLSEHYETWMITQAITRGDGVSGEDITPNIRKMANFKELELELSPLIPGKIFSARCETILKKDDLDRINSTLSEKNVYKNCRNAAAGISRRLDGKYCKYLHRIYYDILTPDEPLNENDKIELLKGMSFLTVPYAVGDVKNMIEQFNKARETRDNLPFGIDGMVIKINSCKKQQELGYSRGRPRGQIAWKFDPPSAATYLLKVTWEVGRTGVITPLGWVDPVEVDGSTISKVTLHNIAEIKRLGIDIGDLVMLAKRGDIIPKIESVIEHKNNPIEIPTRCPCCGDLLTNDGIRLMCVNDLCDAKNFQRILNFIKTTKIDEFGEALAEKLWDSEQLRGIADVLRLKQETIAGIEGWGEKSADTIMTNVNSLRNAIDPVTFLASMGVPSLSISTAEDLWARYGSIKGVLEATVEDICTIKGYSTVSATKIVQGLKFFRTQIEEVLGLVNLQETKSAGGRLSGQSFCFTGEMTNSRSFYQGLVTKQGGKNDSTVTKTTTYLVCNENKGSSKSRKAEQYGVKIINEQQFMDMAGESIPKKTKVVTQSLFEEE
ncbi:MAG: NAD-dependent DNA ligase LigA [Bacteroidetes bacterium]|nr:NAD-dependent DNA ligase LigA [Bacteroidota bacterium]